MSSNEQNTDNKNGFVAATEITTDKNGNTMIIESTNPSNIIVENTTDQNGEHSENSSSNNIQNSSSNINQSSSKENSSSSKTIIHQTVAHQAHRKVQVVQVLHHPLIVIPKPVLTQML